MVSRKTMGRRTAMKKIATAFVALLTALALCIPYEAHEIQSAFASNATTGIEQNDLARTSEDAPWIGPRSVILTAQEPTAMLEVHPSTGIIWEWVSTNKEVATVTNLGQGLARVTAVGTGTAFVIASDISHEASCIVIVDLGNATAEQPESTNPIVPVEPTEPAKPEVSPEQPQVQPTLPELSIVEPQPNVPSENLQIAPDEMQPERPQAALNVPTQQPSQEPQAPFAIKPFTTTFTSLQQSRLLYSEGLSSGETIVSWTSSDASIATVSNYGQVAPRSNGTARITARTSSGRTASCTVTVALVINPTSISLNRPSATFLSKGSTTSLIATVFPTNATNKNVSWSTSNSTVATVSQTGKVTAVGNGTAYIYARTANGKTATCTVTVAIKIDPTSIRLNKNSQKLTVKGSSFTLSATVLPTNATNKTVRWSTSNSTVATVSQTGKVTAVGNGTAYIYARTANGKTATCTVTVAIRIYPTSLQLSKTSYKFTSKGSTIYLTSTVKPTNATDKSVTWWSSNKSVATVTTGGKVTAVGNGTAYIYAQTVNGIKASCTVTVAIPAANPSSSAANLDLLAHQIFDAYNDYRASQNLNRVVWNGTLAAWGRASAQACAARRSLNTHQLGIPANARQWCTDILQYSSWKMTAQQAITNWRNSSGHRKMMQCPSTTEAGVGIYNDNGIYYYAIVYNFNGYNQGGN